MNAPSHQVKKCRSCDASMIYLPTKNGKQMPVNADTVSDDDQMFDITKHISHFATCSDGARFRK